MNFNLLHSQNYHFIALISSAVINFGVVVFAIMQPSKPMVVNQQVIQVSFVAPSDIAQKRSDKSDKEPVVIVKSNDADAIKVKKENNQKSEEQKIEKLASNKQTSGRQKEDAVDLNSAETDPVFNAAYLNNPAPNYPISAKRKNIQGKVLILVLVKEDGTPAKVEISHSSGSEELDRAAIDAVQYWRFIPAHRGKKAVEASVIVPVEFKLN